MRRFYPTIKRESLASQHKAGRYNPAFVLPLQCGEVALPHGSNDDVYFWRGSRRIMVLTVSARHGYAGLVKYDETDGSTCAEVFIQRAEEIPDGFFDRSPACQRRYLEQYL